MRLSRRVAVVLTAALFGPALPSLATTSTTAVVAPLVSSTGLALGTTTAALGATDQLVGVTWASGAPTVRVRWLTPEGWTAHETPEDDSDVPTSAEREAAREGTEPVWRPTGATLVGRPRPRPAQRRRRDGPGARAAMTAQDLRRTDV